MAGRLKSIEINETSARKLAPQREVSAEDSSRSGYVKLRRGRLERNAPDGETPWSYEHAMRALGPIAFCAFIYVLDRTFEGYKPGPADIDENDLADVLRVSVRHVRGIIDTIIKTGAITRDPENYWRLSAHVGCLETLPARAPIHRPRTKPERAELRAPQKSATFVAAAVEEMHFPPTSHPVEAPAASVGEMQFPEMEPKFRPRETYCPWNWTCPYLASNLPAPKTLDLVDIKPTTTGARASGLENAYLARFLQPVTRIGELLKIDDALAGEMWTAASAKNPALTPRKFVSIAERKLDEWRPRPLDKYPGLKIKSSINGTLRASMPSAVCGALYMAAHEAAPAELERDCYKARAILDADVSETSPWSRAWAAAMLAEADGYDTRQNLDEEAIAAIAARYLR